MKKNTPSPPSPIKGEGDAYDGPVLIPAPLVGEG